MEPVNRQGVAGMWGPRGCGGREVADRGERATIDVVVARDDHGGLEAAKGKSSHARAWGEVAVEVAMFIGRG